MKQFITKSLIRGIEDKDVEKNTVTSFISFSRAIEESLAYNRSNAKPIGYTITEQGIILHLQN